MKRKLKKDFSYTMMLFRGCQFLLAIGMLIQITKLITMQQAMLGLIIYVIVLIVSIFGEKKIASYIRGEVKREVTEITNIKDSMFSNVQIPLAIIEELGNIKWCNSALNELIKEKSLIGMNIKNLFPESKIGEWIHEKQPLSKKLKIGSKSYELMLEIFHRQDGIKQYGVYFLDCTEKEKLKVQMEEERTIIGYLCIDNVDEINQSIEEVRRPMLMAIIDRKINLWFKEREVVIVRTERDKYMLILSKKELKKMEETKFDILDEVRSIQVGNELPITVSIGIGYNLKDLSNSKEDARIAFDLAQGRGGDQAIIKHHDKYTF